MDPSHFHRKPSPKPTPRADVHNINIASGPNGQHNHSNLADEDETDPSSLSLSPLTADAEECYDSTAFFVREGLTGEEKEMLFFGDVEPGEYRFSSWVWGEGKADDDCATDSISKRPLNLAVWKAAAPKIVAGKLAAIFLECSYPVSWRCVEHSVSC